MQPNHRTRTQGLAFLAAALLTFSAGCGLEEEDEVADTSGSIKLGAVLPLSGAASDTGAFIRDGYEDWADHLNSNGGVLGRQVELVVEDDTSDPGRSVALLEKLITQDQVDLLLGGYPTPSGTAQMVVAEQYQKVLVGMGGGLSSWEQGFEYSFGAPPLMADWWYDAFFDFLESVPQSERPTKAAMISINDPLGNAFREGAIESLEEAGIELVMDERYELPLANAQPLVLEARNAGADLFISNSLFDDGVAVIRAVRALNYRPKAILEGIGTLVPNWKRELGSGGDEIFSGTPIHANLPFEGVDTANRLAEERYGTPAAPTYFLYGAAWLDVLAKAVEGAGTVDDEEIASWLRANEVSSLAGKVSFDERGLPPREQVQYLVQVKDGRAELVWPEAVQTSPSVYPTDGP